MAKSNEPLVWAPFFAGAGFSAVFMPVLIIIMLFASYGGPASLDLRDLVNHWYVRVALFILISLSLFHALHRIRFILVDLGLKAVHGLIAVLCYSLAVIGTLVALLIAAGI